MNKLEFSLLWQTDNKVKFNTLPERTINDLNIDSMVNKLTRNRKKSTIFKSFLTQLPQDIEIIRHRQNSFEDIMENKLLRDTLNQLSPYLSSLLYFNGRVKKEDSPLFEMIFRINELDKLLCCVDTLDSMFKDLKRPVQSNGFLKLKEWVTKFKTKDDYLNLKEKLPGIINSLRQIKSLSLGINLNSSLMPIAVTIEKINTYSFEDRANNLLNTLFKESCKSGLTKLNNSETDESFEHLSIHMKNISKLIDKSTGKVIHGIKEFRNTNSNALINLKNELDFLLEASRLFLDLNQKGVEVTKPVVCPFEHKIMKIEKSRNLDLVLTLGDGVIPSDVDLNSSDSFGLISGPNSGGKTVFLQSLGINQVLAQTGLYVLGSKCQISMVDNIYTHYQIEELPGDDHGRFGVEIKRLKEILPQISSDSLILFNETFTSTNIGEAVYIAEDILRYICEVGARGAFTTHMHTLIDKIDYINSNILSTTKLISMVSELNSKREITYKIVKGSSNSYSYAMEMAKKMGICFDKLMESNIIKCGQKAQY